MEIDTEKIKQKLKITICMLCATLEFVSMWQPRYFYVILSYFF